MARLKVMLFPAISLLFVLQISSHSHRKEFPDDHSVLMYNSFLTGTFHMHKKASQLAEVVFCKVFKLSLKITIRLFCLFKLHVIS